MVTSRKLTDRAPHSAKADTMRREASDHCPIYGHEETSWYRVAYLPGLEILALQHFSHEPAITRVSSCVLLDSSAWFDASELLAGQAWLNALTASDIALDSKRSRSAPLIQLQGRHNLRRLLGRRSKLESGEEACSHAGKRQVGLV